MPDQLPISRIATLDIPEILTAFSTRENGLNDYQARLHQKRYGLNSIVEKEKRSPLIEFLNNFLDPLVLTLLIISITSFLMGNTVNGIIIGVMVAMSVTLNFLQEFKASKAAEMLRDKVAHTVEVTRNSRLIELPAIKLVPGDVIELNAGDLIPADSRIIEARDFFVNQSSLTGESFPVEKSSISLKDQPTDLSMMHNIAFSGTGVHTGWARAVVVATGKSSEFGRLARSLDEGEEEDEFSVALKQFGSMIVKIIIVSVIIIFGIRAFLLKEFWTSFQFAVAVAVGLTPEFLPMIMSVTMGQGSTRMAKKGVIVKKLTSIPTLGSMDVLCTDKTGTLTENKIALVTYVDLYGDTSESTLHHAFLNSHFQSGITNPMDDAVKRFGHLSSKGFKKIDEIPFDFERRKLTVVLKDKKGNGLLITKGAPEEMLSSCTSYWLHGKHHPFTSESKRRYGDLYKKLSEDGFRVLAVATKAIKPTKQPIKKAEEFHLQFSGFIAFLDPAKQGVQQALDELESLGVDLKVITGDNELVASKICKDVDITVKGIILGSAMDAMRDSQLLKLLPTTTIFARFAPEQKNRVIQLLKKSGKVVGYMGDGINDAPSLVTADVGISVANAVDVARESADIVLTHKSLHELVDGVKEGRKTFGNTVKYIMMGLSSNFGNIFSMLGAVIFLPFLPMLPVQILLNNFIYDFTQITIPSDTVDDEYIQKPKRLKLSEIRRFMLLFGPISSLFDFITFGILYYFFSHSPAQFQTGWFIESLATQTLVIHIIRTRLIPFIQSRASVLLTITTVSGIVIGWSLPYIPIGKYLGLMPIGIVPTLILVLVVCVYLVTVEIAKRYFYRRLAITQ